MSKLPVLPLGPRDARVVGAVLAVVSFVVWLLVPPFESPEVLGELTYRQLRERLGAPAEEAPEKYIGWISGRLIGWWVVEVPYAATSNNDDKPTEVERHLAIGVRGYSYNVLRSSSHK